MQTTVEQTNYWLKDKHTILFFVAWKVWFSISVDNLYRNKVVLFLTNGLISVSNTCDEIIQWVLILTNMFTLCVY